MKGKKKHKPTEEQMPHKKLEGRREENFNLELRVSKVRHK